MLAPPEGDAIEDTFNVALPQIAIPPTVLLELVRVRLPKARYKLFPPIAPVRVRLPAPCFWNVPPLVEVIFPENVMSVELPAVNVLDVIIMFPPEPESEAMVWLKPPRSNVPPLLTTRFEELEMALAFPVSSVPELIVVVPV